MKKYLKIILGVVGFILLGIGLLVVAFGLEMKPITIPRTRRDSDEKILNEFISFLKKEDNLQHGTIILEYIAENGVILDDEWEKNFNSIFLLINRYICRSEFFLL